MTLQRVYLLSEPHSYAISTRPGLTWSFFGHQRVPSAFSIPYLQDLVNVVDDWISIPTNRRRSSSRRVASINASMFLASTGLKLRY